MKYIVSLVLTKVTAPEPKQILLASEAGKPALPDISIQNHVSVCTADSAEDAYARCMPIAREAFPDHRVSCKVVIEAAEQDLED